ncbi:YugN-like family protein [Bacillus sp. USDA818B3_A]|uniref:YugN-like family protein n=1 Tax=Bacillus sp. USDA818B3_A TaxID=2698834 RepID=UPI0013722917|nr:YugN-like family protein [Bacillus sp. USDA818B3_A]
MHEIPSKVEGKTFELFKLEQKLKPIGYTIGGNWEYDHGSFDYKLNDEDSYEFLRVPFTAVDGELDTRGCTVEIGRPYLLAHQYEYGIDEHGDTGNFSASLNQFQAPIDEDADIPSQYIDKGKKLVTELEKVILTSD